MTLAASIALLSAGIAVYVAALTRQLARAPGWHDLRHFALVALSGAGYALLNIPTSAAVLSDDAVVVCSRLQLVMAALHSVAWLRYSSVLAGYARPARLDRILGALLAALATVGLLTPAFLPGGVRVHEFAPLGAVYRTAVTTAAGDASYGAVLAGFFIAASRLGAAWRRGVPNTGVQLLALSILLALGVNDALVAGGAYAAPYLGDIGLLLPAAAVGYALTVRFVEHARAHEALRHDLERQVAERTAELGRAQEALHRAEKLAALGQFAAGVAHEVNNPASVVGANLAYLEETQAEALSEEAREAVRESIQSMQRIAAIVRQLLDAGRLAASPEARRSVPLRALGDGAISVARARFGKRARLTNAVPEALHASGHEGVLAQVLVNLVANAVQSIGDHRSDGHVAIRAQVSGDRVSLVVEDNGSGMEPDVLRRAFEPFFTTKPFGSGTGLGLAVSRGLVMSLGGDLRLESAPGAGTRATVELALAPPGPAEPRSAPARAAGPRDRILIVDDEGAVLSALRRLLEPRYGVELASGVDDGLARIEEQRFDLVLCDVMMPGGGGERLYRTLLGRSPGVARRVVFLTGGAVTDAARQFLRSQPQPVLFKPLELEELARVADELRRGPAGADSLAH